MAIWEIWYVPTPTPDPLEIVNINPPIVHNVGPQDVFPVPQGILNHQGANYLAVALWALDTEGGKLDDVQLRAGTAAPPKWRYSVQTVNSPRWQRRDGAY